MTWIDFKGRRVQIPPGHRTNKKDLEQELELREYYGVENQRTRYVRRRILELEKRESRERRRRQKSL